MTGGDWRTVLTVTDGPADGSRYLRHDSPSGILTVCRVAPGYAGETAMQVRIGSSLEDALREYGSSAERLLTVDGEWLIYPESQLVVETAGGRVNGWFLYRVDAVR